MRKTFTVALTAGALVATALVSIGGAPATAHDPEDDTPWIVSLGDSYISGEAGRWAGNTNSDSGSVDAGGPAAYLDNGGLSETIDWCHRSTAAEIHVGRAANGSAVNSLNLACSGARTYTFSYPDGTFKPGIDFYNSGGHQGQALMLQEFAATHDVRMIVLSIGGNNFEFFNIIESCIFDYLTSSSLSPNYCNDDPSVTAIFTRANIAAQTAAIRGAIDNVKTAMKNAGYTSRQYTIVVQTYPSPLSSGRRFRYPEAGFTRQFTGGCGFWNRDADWANTTALGTINRAVRRAADAANNGGNVHILDIATALQGRRLCETGVDLLENTGLASWAAPGAANLTEWVAPIRLADAGPYQVQESLHPNWWGQKALRNCVRQAWNNGAPRGGSCTRSATGLNALGEPKMRLA